MDKPTRTGLAIGIIGGIGLRLLLGSEFAGTYTTLLGAWNGFLQGIRNETNTNFEDVYRNRQRKSLMSALRDECNKKFKKKFRRLCRVLDYEGVVVDAVEDIENTSR